MNVMHGKHYSTSDLTIIITMSFHLWEKLGVGIIASLLAVSALSAIFNKELENFFDDIP